MSSLLVFYRVYRLEIQSVMNGNQAHEFRSICNKKLQVFFTLYYTVYCTDDSSKSSKGVHLCYYLNIFELKTANGSFFENLMAKVSANSGLHGVETAEGGGVSSLGRYVFGSEISYNKAPPRLPGLGC